MYIYMYIYIYTCSVHTNASSKGGPCILQRVLYIASAQVGEYVEASKELCMVAMATCAHVCCSGSSLC